MDRDSLKVFLAQALLQLGLVAALALSAFAFSSCARKNTVPPGAQGSLSPEQLEALAKEQAAAQAAAQADTKAPNATAKSLKNGDKLLALILKDKAMNDYRAQFEQKNNAVCTRPSAGQMHWDCKSTTECAFTLEFTCVSNVGEFADNNEILRLSLNGEGSSAKMTYKISNPSESAVVSRPKTVKFEF
jgi:hypothetical protein